MSSNDGIFASVIKIRRKNLVYSLTSPIPRNLFADKSHMQLDQNNMLISRFSCVIEFFLLLSSQFIKRQTLIRGYVYCLYSPYE